MKWIRYRIRTVPEAEDLIVAAMEEIGLIGAQIEDNVPLTAAEKEQIYTYDTEDPTDDGIAYVSFYTERDDLKEEIAGVLSSLRSFSDIGDGTVDVSVTDDVEWKDKWKQFFHRFFIDDVLVVPSWETCTEEEKQARHVLRIDPGVAFGTGAHETTQLSVRALRKEIDRRLEENRPPSLLDVGTGSGVLSILSLMFGASFAVGADVDPFTIQVTADNLQANGIDQESFRLVIGNLIDDDAVRKEVLSLAADAHVKRSGQGGADEGYDIIVANILPVVLKPLTPLIPRLLAPSGTYICSGILAEKEEEMRGVLTSAGFIIQEVTRQGEWIAMKAKSAHHERIAAE